MVIGQTFRDCMWTLHPMKNTSLCILATLSLVASALHARTLDLELPPLDLSDGQSVWIALDAGPGFGSTAIQVDAERRAFVAFQADLALHISAAGIVEARQYRDFQWQDFD